MLNQIFLKFIRGYQRWVSPLFSPACRFHPSCSEYAAQALNRYSLIRAAGLIIYRILKCNPYHNGGADPLK
ncbi:MAG: membrane protein insertion efficiency factor YidD [Nitrospinaceae bacterium]|nr:membrane protein insertion efficiency factor YidD [Nitrospina sp.]MBT5377047.1 membrane protein insertion efficiency factor YidD [Nitrospinaceae bacterium]MBT6345794.1 membrane protein insertion efficiency factor YidD [Nitrospina sp.]